MRKKAKRIAVLSDTHGLLRPEGLTAIAGCDAIIHDGDINKPVFIDRLKEIAPVYVVRGNNDKGWAEHIPVTLTSPTRRGDCFLGCVCPSISDSATYGISIPPVASRGVFPRFLPL